MSPTVTAPVSNVPGVGSKMPLTVTLIARTIRPSVPTINSGVGPTLTWTSESQLMFRFADRPDPWIDPAWPASTNNASPLKSGFRSWSGELPSMRRRVTKNVTPRSPSTFVSRLTLRLFEPPEAPIQMHTPLDPRSSVTFWWSALTSTPSRPVTMVFVDAVPSIRTVTFELTVRLVSAVADPKSATANARDLPLSKPEWVASSSTVRPSTLASLPMTVLTLLVSELFAWA